MIKIKDHFKLEKVYDHARVSLPHRHRVVRYHLLHRSASRRFMSWIIIDTLPAIMGDITAAVFVRTCYPVVGNAVNLFPDVKYSVGLTLIFVGMDMILDAFDIHLPASVGRVDACVVYHRHREFDD